MVLRDDSVRWMAVGVINTTLTSMNVVVLSIREKSTSPCHVIFTGYSTLQATLPTYTGSPMFIDNHASLPLH
jgi:hypothetical protein